MTPAAGPPTPSGPRRWATLIAARLPRNAAARVRIGRRLRRAGALTVRPGVYALPDHPSARSAIASLRAEIDRGRGSALPGLVAWLDARDERELADRHAAELDRRRRRIARHIERLERSLERASGLRAAERQTANARLARLRGRLEREGVRVEALPGAPAAVRPGAPGSDPGRVWVTRRGVLIDRIASAWLIRRFVDPEARFRFVAGGDSAMADERSFDMPGAEFTHDGDRCTFEVLVARFRPRDEGLRRLGEIVHDLDLKDGRFGHAEAAGVARIISGLAVLEPDDEARLARGGVILDCLYASWQAGPPPRLRDGPRP
ncbi:MAG TPA: chromate resistance protein ChrB domain-containing protein [Candidatus Eisenbacteria bacterium]